MKLKNKKNILNILKIGLVVALTSTTLTTHSVFVTKNNIANAQVAGDYKLFQNISTGNTAPNVDRSNGNLGGAVSVIGGIYYWTVPVTDKYVITAKGAGRAGKGAIMKGEFDLTAGQRLKILVGQQGDSGPGGTAASGSGGTFVTRDNNSALIVAGGGGGSFDATTTNKGNTLGGQAGASTYYNGPGGGGLTGDGIQGDISDNALPGISFVNGGRGGVTRGVYMGGFGGGAGSGYDSYSGGGGGGGYNGGDGGAEGNGGKGGGSYNIGANQSNSINTVGGHGEVLIEVWGPEILTQTPSNGSETWNNTQTFSWTASGSPTRYELRVGTTSGGTDIYQSNTITGASQSVPMPTGTEAADLYWSVRAYNTSDGWGKWSSEYILKYINATNKRVFEVTNDTTSLVWQGKNEDRSKGGLGAVPTFPSAQGIYHWVVPKDGVYKIEARGAQGGSSEEATIPGGKGAHISGEVVLNAGEVLRILVGQQGYRNVYTAGGGGGSFVVKSTGEPLVIAGGGGGAGDSAPIEPTYRDASATTEAKNNSVYQGGNNGNGGQGEETYGGAGGGLLTGGNGTANERARAFVDGGLGGYKSTQGGFGGGGGAYSYTTTNAPAHGRATTGGGGGYSGGAGHHKYDEVDRNEGRRGDEGGGGGSYNAGKNQTNTAGENVGQGIVVVEYIGDFPPVISSQSPANNTETETKQIPISWDATNSPTMYEIRIGSASGASDIYSSADLTAKSYTFTVPTEVQNSKTYYWNVRAFNGTWGEWGEERIVVYNAPIIVEPPVITKQEPPNGEETYNSKPTLFWEATNLPSEYEIRIGSSPGASDIYTNNAYISRYLKFNVENGITDKKTYYWNVRARNEAGWGPWGQEMSLVFNSANLETTIVPVQSVHKTTTRIGTTYFVNGRKNNGTEKEVRLPNEIINK